MPNVESFRVYVDEVARGELGERRRLVARGILGVEGAKGGMRRDRSVQIRHKEGWKEKNRFIRVLYGIISK